MSLINHAAGIKSRAEHPVDAQQCQVRLSLPHLGKTNDVSS